MTDPEDMTLAQWIHRRDFYLHEPQRLGIPRWLREDYRVITKACALEVEKAMREIEELEQEHFKRPFERTEK